MESILKVYLVKFLCSFLSGYCYLCIWFLCWFWLLNKIQSLLRIQVRRQHLFLYQIFLHYQINHQSLFFEDHSHYI